MSRPDRKEPRNRGPWGYVQPWDVKALGPGILDVEEQKRWTRVILFGGPFRARLETDLHLQYWVDKLTHFFPFDIRKTPYSSAEELHAALDDLLEQPEHLEWKGIELFWGRKPRE